MNHARVKERDRADKASAELAAAVAERDRLRAALEGVTQFLDEEEMFFDSGVSVDRLEALLDRARAALAGSTGGGGGGE
jgi:mevalonate kinase